MTVVVIGAGMAGASAAAEIARTREVVLVEMEAQPGHHATGRSAALFDPAYGNRTVRALTRASRSFFVEPPAGFAEHPLVAPRGVLIIAREDQLERLRHHHEELSATAQIHRVDAAQARKLVPGLRQGHIVAALHDPTAMDIDVNELHQGYLRLLRALGGRLELDARVEGLERSGDRWQVRTSRHTFTAEVVVNAAGAWVDEVAALAGLPPLGFTPLRRTALTVAAPKGLDVSSWPLVFDANEQFYVKPDAGRLLVSPADETPMPPCDVSPDELDVATAVDRLERAFEIDVDRVISRWAGLRTFAPDRTPVAGFDPAVPGFLWLGGQGGYGIQTAPALSALVAALVNGASVPAHLVAEGLTVEALSPRRLRGARS